MQPIHPTVLGMRPTGRGVLLRLVALPFSSKLFLELRHLRRHHRTAIRLFAVQPEVFLMVVLRWIEFFQPVQLR